MYTYVCEIVVLYGIKIYYFIINSLWISFWSNIIRNREVHIVSTGRTSFGVTLSCSSWRGLKPRVTITRASFFTCEIFSIVPSETMDRYYTRGKSRSRSGDSRMSGEEEEEISRRFHGLGRGSLRLSIRSSVCDSLTTIVTLGIA